jgi:hypothetical protein
LSSGSANPPLLIVIAIACLAGAGVLAWFSSPARMTRRSWGGGVPDVSRYRGRLDGSEGVDDELIASPGVRPPMIELGDAALLVAERG